MIERRKRCAQCDSFEYMTEQFTLCIICRSDRIEQKYFQTTGRKPTLNSKKLFELHHLENVPLAQISKKEGISYGTVKYWMELFNIPIIKESFLEKETESIFSRLSPETAYLLGFIFTDGDLLFNKETRSYFIRLYSHEKERLEKALALLKIEAKIQFRPEKMYGRKRVGAIYFIHIGRKNIVNDLMNLGMVLDKNQEIRFPELSHDLISHFIRGAWTGSGCVLIDTKSKSIRSSLDLGSLDFISSIENCLSEAGLKKVTIYKHKHTKKPAYRISYSTAESHNLFLYLYKDYTENSIYNKHFKAYYEFYSYWY